MKRSWILSAPIAFWLAVSLAFGGVALAASLVITAQKLTVVSGTTSVAATTCAPTPTPTADAYVDEGSKNSNFGGVTITTLDVWANKNNNKRSFVRFDIASCNIPDGAALQSAKLRLFITTAPTSERTYNASLADAPWTESGITWQNKPGGLGTPAPAAAQITSASSEWFEWNVLSHVQAIRAGTTNNGWQIKDLNEAASNDNSTDVGSEFSSKEGADPPQLVITYYP